MRHEVPERVPIPIPIPIPARRTARVAAAVPAPVAAVASVAPVGPVTFVAFVAAGLLLTGCGGAASQPTPAPSASPSTRASSVPPTVAPVRTGPTTAVAATRCPFLDAQRVHQTLGVRLARQTDLRSGGKVVGCRFYALQHGFLHRTENLPGPNQPVLEVTTARYPTAVAAHNAFVRLAERGTTPTPVPLTSSVTGVCFQDDFDPADKGRDWACTVSAGVTVVVVRSVDTTGTLNTSTLTAAVLAKLPATR